MFLRGIRCGEGAGRQDDAGGFPKVCGKRLGLGSVRTGRILAARPHRLDFFKGVTNDSRLPGHVSCKGNAITFRLRGGASREQRFLYALDPERSDLDSRTRTIVFEQPGAVQWLEYPLLKH